MAMTFVAENSESDTSNQSDISENDADDYRVAQWSGGEDEDIADNAKNDDVIPSSKFTFGALAKSNKQQAPADANDYNGESSKTVNSERVSSNSSVKRPRSNKHAPTEVSSKFPVSRRKVAQETTKLRPHDPRFSATGEFSSDIYKKNYQFISEIRQNELSVLKDNLKRARKLLISSPRDLREEREAEVERLERAVKRAESSVNRDRREELEQTAIQKVVNDEKEKRKQGKKTWYLKHSVEKEIKLRARYEGLKASGGAKAVKKALEKRQKKLHQADKKRSLL